MSFRYATPSPPDKARTLVKVWLGHTHFEKRANLNQVDYHLSSYLIKNTLAFLTSEFQIDFTGV
jgi:hypothetical protein